MRVSLRWLRELVDVTETPSELAERLDMTGTAVEAVESVGEGLEGVVIGQVLTREAHPDAEKLSVSLVDIGGEEPLHIVCGAPNYNVGDKVAVALVGTTLPNGITLKKAKIRGEVSEGMMCADDELGLGTDHTGLVILPSDAPLGVPFADYHGLADTVFDLEITPNRPDCLSMVGVAREVAAITRRRSRIPEFEWEESGEPAEGSVSVEIEDPRLCLRYVARVVRGVRIGPSPAWLAERVMAAGARPINNVVDVTNYVMFEMGQPLHAFDMGKVAVSGGKADIIVRLARPGEDLVTLDGQDRQLADDTLLITDPSGPIALAGVMGGESTEVSEKTTDILIEAACFDPASVSRTSRRLGLISEASQRFERGVDANGCDLACSRAAQLIAETGGGEIAPGHVDAYPERCRPVALHLRVERTNAILGTGLVAGEVVSILERLGLATEKVDTDLIRVMVPTFRPDLTREIDLIEEIVRVYGMGNVPSTLPAGRERIGGLTLAQQRRARCGEALRAAGMTEAITWSFADPGDLDRLGLVLGPGEEPVRLLNPMVEDQSILRPTTLPGFLRAVANNQRKGVSDVRLYEIGTVWWTAEGRKQPKEREVAAGVLAGRWDAPQWYEDAKGREEALDFFDGKGVLETLFEALFIDSAKLRPTERSWLQPGRSADVIVEGDVVGWIGEVHPRVLEAYEAEGPVTAFEIALKPVLKAAREAGDFTDLPRFPAAKADIAIVVDTDVPVADVASAIRSAGGRLLESVRLFDVYTGEGVPAGRKSLAFSLTYRDPERTLTDEEVAKVHEKVVRKATTAVGGELRG